MGSVRGSQGACGRKGQGEQGCPVLPCHASPGTAVEIGGAGRESVTGSTVRSGGCGSAAVGAWSGDGDSALTDFSHETHRRLQTLLVGVKGQRSPR